MLRILMLCGFTQNAYVYRGRLGAIRRALGDKDYELVFIDPPHILDTPTTSAADFDSNTNSESTKPDELPRTWWFAEGTGDQTRFKKLDETLIYLRDVVENQGPWDGVWGFSQGAAMAGMLAALAETPTLHPVFASMTPRPFKFAILSCGFVPADPMVKAWFTPSVKTPALHVLGRADTIVEEERSIPFTKVFENSRVEWHDGGHHTPTKASWRKFFKAYIDLFAESGSGHDGGSTVASPSSGADTPVDAAGGKL